MPLPDTAVAAARKAAARRDYRLLAYWQAGFVPRPVAPAVKSCDTGQRLGMAGRQDFRWIDISSDKNSLGCCDRSWTPDACGVRQEDYAAAYNLELIRLDRRRIKCSRLEIDAKVR